MSVQSLTRAFDIVGLLAQEQQGFTLSTIAEQLDLPTSTVYRLLSALKERGYVEQTKKSGVYRLGMTFVDMSSLYLNRLELKTEAEPIMRELSMLTGQTAFLAIRDQWQIVYMEKMEQFSSLRKYCIIGQRKPVYATSLGKSLLLDLEDGEIEALLTGVEFERFGPKTHSDLPRLLFDIQSSRERGWTLDDEEAEGGVRCVAAPIHDYRSQAIAAVSVSWAISAFPDMDIGKAASHVMRAALEISRHMGYQPIEQ
jgi:IclR family transcriptional regulator, KDG regulon repressor